MSLSYFPDFDLSIQSAMTGFFTETFSSFHFKRDHFITFHFADDFSIYFYRNIFAKRERSVTIRKKNIAEFQFVAGFAIEMWNKELLAFTDAELLTGYFYNCKHNMPKFRSAKVRGKSFNPKIRPKKS